jgi:hypothetical protein
LHRNTADRIIAARIVARKSKSGAKVIPWRRFGNSMRILISNRDAR